VKNNIFQKTPFLEEHWPFKSVTLEKGQRTDMRLSDELEASSLDIEMSNIQPPGNLY
jgi:hypothetical protein